MIPPSISTFGAAPSMVGYLYQVRLALLWAIRRSRTSDFVVSLETLDDVSFEVGGEPLAVLQAAVGREVRLIRIDEVIYFESDARYTRVVTAEGDALIRTPLKELLAQLDEREFWQVHRSVIVNHRHIASAVRIDEGQMQLTLRGRPERLPVSRHFQALFKGQ